MQIKPMPKILNDDDNADANFRSNVVKMLDQLAEGHNRHEDELKALNGLNKILKKMTDAAEKDEQVQSL